MWLNDGTVIPADSGPRLGVGASRGPMALGLLDDDATLDAKVATNGGADSVIF